METGLATLNSINPLRETRHPSPLAASGKNSALFVAFQSNSTDRQAQAGRGRAS